MGIQRSALVKSFGYRFFLINQLIPIIGLIFFHWNYFDIFLIFFIDIFLYGAIQVLKILTARKGLHDWFSFIFPKVVVSFMFSAVFIAIYVIVFGRVLSTMDTKTSKVINIDGAVFSFWAMVFNYGYYFVFGYMAKGEYKKTSLFSPVVSTFVRLFPISILLLFLILPQAKNFKGYTLNIYILSGIIIARALVDLVILKYSLKHPNTDKDGPLAPRFQSDADEISL